MKDHALWENNMFNLKSKMYCHRIHHWAWIGPNWPSCLTEMDPIAIHLGFQIRCVLNPCDMFFHPAKVLLKVFSILFKIFQRTAIKATFQQKFTNYLLQIWDLDSKAMSFKIDQNYLSMMFHDFRKSLPVAFLSFSDWRSDFSFIKMIADDACVQRWQKFPIRATN